jgi:hypothetical protein
MSILTGNHARPYFASGTPYAAWAHRHGTRAATDAEMRAEYGCTLGEFMHAWRELKAGEWQRWLADKRKGRAA